MEYYNLYIMFHIDDKISDTHKLGLPKITPSVRRYYPVQ